MSDTKAPERVWLERLDRRTVSGLQMVGGYTEMLAGSNLAEYIRADIAEKILASNAANAAQAEKIETQAARIAELEDDAVAYQNVIRIKQAVIDKAGIGGERIYLQEAE